MHLEPKNRRNNMRIQTALVITLLIASMAIVPGSSVLAATSADEQLTPAEAKDIAREAFLLGTPLRTAQVMV
jgi:hypothetical protein